MIAALLLTQIRLDYYTSDDQNILNITAEEADSFWEWFGNEAAVLHTTNMDDCEENKHYQAGQCFTNAQTETLKEGRLYYEGFFLVNQRHYLHAFNVCDDHILDVTVFN